MILEHLAIVAGHEALHHAYKVWLDAKSRENIQDLLWAAWELLESVRLSKLFDANGSGALAAAEIAGILCGLREYKDGYATLKRSKPMEFEQLMGAIAMYDYELRDPHTKYKGNSGLAIVSMDLKIKLESVGIVNLHERAKAKRASKKSPSPNK